MSFGSLMDIDKLIPGKSGTEPLLGFGSLMDIDKLIRCRKATSSTPSFGSLMDIDKLILDDGLPVNLHVLVL